MSQFVLVKNVSNGGQIAIAKDNLILATQKKAPTVVKVFPGGIVNLNTGTAGSSNAVDISPPIPGLAAANVYDAIAELATVQNISATAIGGHRVVYMAADGFRYASNDDISHAGLVIGITTGSAGQNTQTSIKTSGEVTEPSWDWTVPGLIFLGQNGLLTQSSPGPPALFSQVVARVISPTKIFINIQPPIILN